MDAAELFSLLAQTRDHLFPERLRRLLAVPGNRPIDIGFTENVGVFVWFHNVFSP
jgi:hypothetical protein